MTQFRNEKENRRRGYLRGLREARRVISEMLVRSNGFDADYDEFDTASASLSDTERRSVAPGRRPRRVRPADNDGVKMLFRAVAKGNRELCRELVDQGVDLNAESGDYVEWKKYATSVVKKYIDEYAFETTDTPLTLAAARGYDEICKILINGGADVDGAVPVGTPLIMAAGQNHASTCKLLLKSGADVNFKAWGYNYTPLHVAAADSSLDICEMFVAKGAALNAKDMYNRTPLYDAINSHRTDIVDFLLDVGAVVDIQDDEGNTPLHKAVETCDFNLVKPLLDASDNIRRLVSTVNKDGETAADVAHRCGAEEIADYLDAFA